MLIKCDQYMIFLVSFPESENQFYTALQILSCYGSTNLNSRVAPKRLQVHLSSHALSSVCESRLISLLSAVPGLDS